MKSIAGGRGLEGTQNDQNHQIREYRYIAHLYVKFVRFFESERQKEYIIYSLQKMKDIVMGGLEPHLSEPHCQNTGDLLLPWRIVFKKFGQNVQKRNPGCTCK